jgi:dTDP-4-amino-4,6-dideoxygalactose transaminase
MARKYDLKLIEDNAHGFGGSFNSKALGTFGAISTLSFHETKNITCGEGGAIVLNDESFVERAEILREKGTDRTRFLRGQVDKYTWNDLGSSWIPSDILASVLAGQLERFDEIQEKRMNIWNNYASGLKEWARTNYVRLPQIPAGAAHSAHMFFLRLPSLVHRDALILHLKSAGIEAVFHYQPLHLSPVGLHLGGAQGQLPVAEEAAETLVRLPLFEDLTESQQDFIVATVTEFRLA